MLLTRHYEQGTVAVGAGDAAVTGSGTGWLGAVRAGDVFWIAGISCRIASVDSGTALTLAHPWPGAAASAAAYEIWLTPDDVMYGEATRRLIDMLRDGALAALSEVDAEADKLPYFDGDGTATTMAFTEALRALLGGLPVLLSVSSSNLVTTAVARLTGGAVQSGATDTTQGRALVTRSEGGAFGLGNTGALAVAGDCNTLTATGFYAVATTTANTPVAAMTGTMLHVMRSSGLAVQIVIRSASVTGSCALFYRTGLTPGGGWSGWIQVATV